MSEMIEASKAAWIALCRYQPYRAVKHDCVRFGAWMHGLTMAERREIYQDIGMAVIEEQIKERRGSNG